MEVKAITKMVKISAFKARNVTRHIQGLGVQDAADILRFSPQKAAFFVGKTLKTAIANAENNFNLSAGNLFVKEAVINEGPTFKRSQPKARGSAGPIRKRTSHIRIILAVREEKPSKETKNTKAKETKTKGESKAKTKQQKS